jgi:hypothetical protein
VRDLGDHLPGCGIQRLEGALVGGIGALAVDQQLLHAVAREPSPRGVAHALRYLCDHVRSTSI